MNTAADDSSPGLSVGVRRVIAPNPGPMTLEGTNTYVFTRAELGTGGAGAWIVDPGPKDAGHLAELIRLSCSADLHPRGILITHRHADHVDGAGTLRRQLENRSGREVPLWAVDIDAVPAALPMPPAIHGVDGEIVGHVIHVPGHTADSVALLLAGGQLLAGDTLLGGSSTVIAEPDGDLGEYLQSLAILRALAVDGRISSIHPGHGHELTDPLSALSAIEEAIEHRKQRIEQVREARAHGALTVDRIVRAVYGAELTDPALEQAARSSVKATLRYLTESRD